MITANFICLFLGKTVPQPFGQYAGTYNQVHIVRDDTPTAGHEQCQGHGGDKGAVDLRKEPFADAGAAGRRAYYQQYPHNELTCQYNPLLGVGRRHKGKKQGIDHHITGEPRDSRGPENPHPENEGLATQHGRSGCHIIAHSLYLTAPTTQERKPEQTHQQGPYPSGPQYYAAE